MSAAELSKSQVNHLRRLLGWVKCEIGQAPDEYLKSLTRIAGPLVCAGYVPDEGSEKRLREGFEASKRVPKYIRDAVKALEKLSYDSADETGSINQASLSKELIALGRDDEPG